MLSDKAMKTWGEPFNGKDGGIKGIPDLELTFQEHNMPYSHRAKCRYPAPIGRGGI